MIPPEEERDADREERETHVPDGSARSDLIACRRRRRRL
jgi:hypothetical protein